MNTIITLVLLLGVQAPAAPAPAATGPLRYQVRFVDCEGLGWRASVQCRLSFCGHVGGSTAWIADESAVSALFDHVAADPADRIVAAPAVTSEPGTPATIQSSTTRNLVVHAGGPGGPMAARPDGAPAEPITAAVDDGTRLTVAGRPVPMGTHLGVEVIDARFDRVHEVPTRLSASGSKGVAVVQVPEVSRCELRGEWTVPTGSSLILSLGATTDPGDADTVRERLLVITPACESPAAEHVAIRFDGKIRRAAAAKVDDAVAAPTAPKPAATAHVAISRVLALPIPIGSHPIVLVPIARSTEVSVADGPTAAAMPLPALPSRNLPGDAGSPSAAATEDVEAGRVAFIKGQPVPSPQAAVTAADATADDAVRPASAPVATTTTAEPALLVRIRLGAGRSIEFRYDAPPMPEQTAAKSGGEAVERR